MTSDTARATCQVRAQYPGGTGTCSTPLPDGGACPNAARHIPALLYAVHWPFGTSDVAGALLTPDGACLWQHVSSSVGWSLADLTVNFGRADMLTALYPGGFRVEQVPWADAPPELLAAVHARAEANARELLNPAEAAASVGDMLGGAE